MKKTHANRLEAKFHETEMFNESTIIRLDSQNKENGILINTQRLEIFERCFIKHERSD